MSPGWRKCTLWAGAVILVAMLFDARTPMAAKLMAAVVVMPAVWLPWFVAGV